MPIVSDGRTNGTRVVTDCVDRTHKLKALGNALVPQIPYLIFQALEQSA